MLKKNIILIRTHTRTVTGYGGGGHVQKQKNLYRYAPTRTSTERWGGRKATCSKPKKNLSLYTRTHGQKNKKTKSLMPALFWRAGGGGVQSPLCSFPHASPPGRVGSVAAKFRFRTAGEVAEEIVGAVAAKKSAPTPRALVAAGRRAVAE
eukprot:GEMP01095522.1.p1 GENE.GEMP01095522.1~~GEMP01095522.1.p1  ORF type:complete len:150 (-),score=22.00 GEMP01095522.1:204-653(-)